MNETFVSSNILKSQIPLVVLLSSPSIFFAPLPSAAQGRSRTVSQGDKIHEIHPRSSVPPVNASHGCGMDLSVASEGGDCTKLTLQLVDRCESKWFKEQAGNFGLNNWSFLLFCTCISWALLRTSGVCSRCQDVTWAITLLPIHLLHAELEHG